MNTIIYLAET